MTMRIPNDELIFHPHSFADPAGRLFWWNGELYRGIRANSALLFRDLLHDGTLQRLSDAGLLIQTELTEFHLDGYEFVVRHRAIPFASYPEEWCPLMLKDAALTLLNLLIELARCGLTLKDAHPWNLLFDCGRPVYVDLTSITRLGDDPQWRAEDQFRHFYLNPLLLMAHGQERIARRLLFEYDGVLDTDVSALTPNNRSSRFVAAMVRRFKKSFNPHSCPNDQEKTPRLQGLLDYFRRTRQHIEDLRLREETSSNDTNTFEPRPLRAESWMPALRAVEEFLTQRNPLSVLDVGVANNGSYAMAAANSCPMTVATGTDSVLLTKLYRAAHERRLPLLPVFMDFTDPTPARGLCSHWSMPATERFKCDLVLALADVHQFFFRRSLPFDLIVEGLSSFSKRWLIAEFTPGLNHRKAPGQLEKSNAWYTLEMFAAALKRRFPSVSALQSSPSGSVLLLCAK